MDASDATSQPLEHEYEHGKTLNKEKFSHINHKENQYKDKHIKTKRGYGKKKSKRLKEKNQFIKFNVLGSNANGILNKLESLKHNIDKFQPSIVTLQETKARKMGSIRLKGYQIFEKIRSGGGGGGLLTAVDQNLCPVLISTGKYEDSEIITVQAKVGVYDVRIINAYGPQEEDGNDIVFKFWQEIEQEIVDAKDENCLVIVQLDANAKIGKENLKDDPNNVTDNGKILLDVVERNTMCIVNTLDLCKGLITRERTAALKIEKSVIDYVLICEDMKKYVVEMNIDDERIHVLTKYAGKRGKKKRVQSDHNIMHCKFSITFERLQSQVRKEFFNLKCEEGKKAFFEET